MWGWGEGGDGEAGDMETRWKEPTVHLCACVHKLTSSLVGKNRTREETCLKTMAGFAWSLSLAPEGLVVSLQMSFGPL